MHGTAKAGSFYAPGPFLLAFFSHPFTTSSPAQLRSPGFSVYPSSTTIFIDMLSFFQRIFLPMFKTRMVRAVAAVIFSSAWAMASASVVTLSTALTSASTPQL